MTPKKQALGQARSFLKLSLENGALSPERVAGVLAYLEAHQQRHALSTLKAYYKLVQVEVAKGQAVVEQATPLTEATLQAIGDALKKKYNRPITVTTKTNRDLIAGMRVRIGDDVYETSIAGQLESLAAAST